MTQYFKNPPPIRTAKAGCKTKHVQLFRVFTNLPCRHQFQSKKVGLRELTYISLKLEDMNRKLYQLCGNK